MSDDRTVIDFDRTRVSAEGQLLFGKHKGEYLDDVAQDDPTYLDWVLDEIDELSEGEREDVEDARAGKSKRKRLHPVTSLTLPAAAPPSGRALGSTMRAGDLVEITAPISPLFKVGSRARVDSVDGRGGFSLFVDGSVHTVRVFEPHKAGSVVVVERAEKPALRLIPGGKTPADEAPSPQLALPLSPPPPSSPSPLPPTSAPLLTPSDPFGLPPLDELQIEPAWVWTDEQRAALDELIAWARGQGPRIASLTGFAGSGKSTMLRELIQHAPSVHPAAMTGKAALRLRELIGRATSTLHAVLYKPPEERRGGDLDFSNRKTPTMATLFIDEASLVTPQIFLDLQEWAARGVRILLVGDPMQLPPILSKQEVEVWGEDFTVFEKVKGPTLVRVMRAGGPILAAATFLRENRRVQTKSEGSYRFTRVADPLAQSVADYLADPSDHVVLTWRNELRLQANARIRARLGRLAKLPERGEPVLIRQNQGAYLNGEIVIADHWAEGPTIGGEGEHEGLKTTWLCTADGAEILTLTQGSRVWMDGLRPYIEDWAAWRSYCREVDDRPSDAHGAPCPIPVPVTWGYVLTGHAMQGSQARRVTTFLGPGDGSSPNFRKPSRLPSGESVPMGTRWLYTATTRATERQTLYVSGS